MYWFSQDNERAPLDTVSGDDVKRIVLNAP